MSSITSMLSTEPGLLLVLDPLHLPLALRPRSVDCPLNLGRGSVIPDKKTMYSVGIGSSVLGFLYGLDPATFTHYLSATANNQIAQAGFFFTAAAWLHANKVKKEIKANFSGLTDAINQVASALRQDLSAHANRIDSLVVGQTELKTEVTEIKSRVVALETIKGE